MSYGRGMQIERGIDRMLATWEKPWGRVSHSHRLDKKFKHKRERHRAKQDIECVPEYNRYDDYEY